MDAPFVGRAARLIGPRVGDCVCVCVCVCVRGDGGDGDENVTRANASLDGDLAAAAAAAAAAADRIPWLLCLARDAPAPLFPNGDFPAARPRVNVGLAPSNENPPPEGRYIQAKVGVELKGVSRS